MSQRTPGDRRVGDGSRVAPLAAVARQGAAAARPLKSHRFLPSNRASGAMTNPRA